LVGERWSLLILHDALSGSCARCSQFRQRLGLATTVLAERLEGFVAAGRTEHRQPVWRAASSSVCPAISGWWRTSSRRPASARSDFECGGPARRCRS
jgi:hypothetical protein